MEYREAPYPEGHEHSADGDADCWGCHIYSIQFEIIRPLTLKSPPPRVVEDSYAKGVPTDHRGVPFVDSALNPLGQRKVNEKRHLIEDTLRSRHNLRDGTPNV